MRLCIILSNFKQCILLSNFYNCDTKNINITVIIVCKIKDAVI